MRADAIIRTGDNQYIIYEFKSSETAPYTTNQTSVFNSISNGGSVRLVGRNGAAFGDGATIPGNTTIYTIRLSGTSVWGG